MTPHVHKTHEALVFIREFTTEHGYPPTRREMGDALGIMSSSTVQVLIRNMIEEGLIEVAPKGARAISVTGTNMKHGEVTL